MITKDIRCKSISCGGGLMSKPCITCGTSRCENCGLSDDDVVCELEKHIEQLQDALGDIVQWSEAYPLSVFPEPDLAKVRQLLEAGGITLDSVSASNMRRVVAGVGKIAREALGKG